MSAVKEIQAAIPYVFNMAHFTDSWKKAKIRPSNGDANPSRTNTDFCEYDEPTKTYRYTKAWVQRLIKKCSTPDGFLEMTGRKPWPKPAKASSS